MSEFKVGDVVRMREPGCSWHDQEGTVARYNATGSYSVEYDPDKSPIAMPPGNLTLVRPAPLSDSKEPAKGWVPAVGARMVRVGRPDLTGRIVGIQRNLDGPNGYFTIQWDSGQQGCLHRSEIEPAPPPAAVEGGQGKEDSPVDTAQPRPSVPRSSGCAEKTGGGVVPSRATSGRYNGNDLERERLMCSEMKREDELPLTLGGPSRRDNLIAALAREMDQGVERRASVKRSKYDPTPWQDWPKGWDDEP